MKRTSIVLAILALVSLGTVPQAMGASINWSAGGGAGNLAWSSTFNWTGGVLPAAADDVVFSLATSGTANLDAALSRTVNSVSFSGTGNWALTTSTWSNNLITSRINVTTPYTVAVSAYTSAVSTTFACNVVPSGTLAFLATSIFNSPAADYSFTGGGVVEYSALYGGAKSVYLGPGTTLDLGSLIYTNARRTPGATPVDTIIEGTVSATFIPTGTTVAKNASGLPVNGGGNVIIRGTGAMLNAGSVYVSNGTTNVTLDNSVYNLTDRIVSANIFGRLTLIGSSTGNTTESITSGLAMNKYSVWDLEHGAQNNVTLTTTAFDNQKSMIALVGPDLNGSGTYSSQVVYSAGTFGQFLPSVRIGTNFAQVGTSPSGVGKALVPYYGATVANVDDATTTSNVLATADQDLTTGNKTINSLKLVDADLNVNGNALTISSNQSAPLIATGANPITISDIAGGGKLKSGGNLGNYDNIYLTNDVDLTISAPIQTMGIVKNGTGKLSITGLVTTGSTGGAVIVVGEGSLDYRSPSTTLVTVYGAPRGTDTLYFGAPTTVSIGSSFDNLSSGGVIVNSGTLAVAQDISYGCNTPLGSGTTTVNAGAVLNLTQGSAWNPIVLTGATLLANLSGGVPGGGNGTVYSPVTMTDSLFRLTTGYAACNVTMSGSSSFYQNTGSMTGNVTMSGSCLFYQGLGNMVGNISMTGSSTAWLNGGTVTGQVTMTDGTLMIDAGSFVAASTLSLASGHTAALWTNAAGKTVYNVIGGGDFRKLNAGLLTVAGTIPNFGNVSVEGGGVQVNLIPPDQTAATISAGQNSGVVTVTNGGMFAVNIQPSTTNGTAGPTTITNAIVVGAGGGGAIGADFTRITKVTFNNSITVNGPLLMGQNDGSIAYVSAPLEFAGTMTINALTPVSSYRMGPYSHWRGGVTSVDLYSPIVSGTYPVILRALERGYGSGPKGLLNVYGTKDYTTGTVIEESSSYSMYASPNMLYGEVVAGTTARLGTGNVLVLPGARFRASATTNLDAAAKVQVRSSSLALGEFNLDVLNATGSMMDSQSDGILYISQNTNAITDLSTLGNGKMFLGARYLGTTYNLEQQVQATTLLPCSDDVYRFTARSSYNSIMRIGTSGSMILSDTVGHIRSVQIGSNKINGGGSAAPAVGGLGVIRLDGDYQTYSGGTDVYYETLQNQLVAASTNSTPFGTGAVRLHGGGVDIANGTLGNVGNVSSLSFEGASWASANYTGSGTVGSVTLAINGAATRLNNGVLFVQATTLGTRSIITIGSGAPARENANAFMVAPYFMTNTGTTDFVDYGAAGQTGFSRVAYTADNTNIATWSFDKIAALPITVTSTLTADTNIWAIRVAGANLSAWNSVAVGSNQLSIGSGGLIFNQPANIIGSGTYGGKLRFGNTLSGSFVAKEAVIYVADALGSNTGRIASIYPQITDAAGITKVGLGSLKLCNTNNTFQGNIVVNEGTLEFAGTNDDGTFGNAANKVVLNGGALQLVPSVTASYSINREIVIGDLNGVLSISNTTGKTLTLNGNITDMGNHVGILNINSNLRATENFTGGGLNTFVINGAANSYAGGTFIQGANIVQMNAASSLGGGDVAVGFGSTLTLQGVTNVADTAKVSVAQGGAINFQGASETIGNLGGTGSVVLGGAADTALTFGDASDATFYGQISQAAGRTGSVTKTGTGSFTFVGPQAFTGLMTVNQGTLNLPSSASLAGGAAANGASTLNVLGRIAAGATLNGSALLQGSGTIAGLLTANGGTVKPSGLTVGSLAMLPAATFQSDVAGASSYHSLIVNGTTDLGGANLAVNLNYAPTLGDSYTLVDNRGPSAITGTFASLTQGQLLNKSYSGTRYWLQMSYTGGTGNDAVLQAVATPLAVLSGLKFNDANHNGSQDTGELGLEGWTINLFTSSGTVTAVTDTLGAYSFSLANLAAPTAYTLTETGSTGWTQTAPVGGSWTGTIDAGQTIAGLDFGNYVAVTDIPGDINRDHIVDQADYTVWYNHYGQTPATWTDGDVTGDNIVDQADYTVWYNHYGQTGGNVPEPMTLSLLAIGGLAMLRRRK